MRRRPILLGALVLLPLAGCYHPAPGEDNSKAVITMVELDGKARIAVCLGDDGRKFKVLVPARSWGQAGAPCPDGKRF